MVEKCSLSSTTEKKFIVDGVLGLTQPSERSKLQRCVAEVAIEIFWAINLLFAVSRAFEMRDLSSSNLSWSYGRASCALSRSLIMLRISRVTHGLRLSGMVIVVSGASVS